MGQKILVGPPLYKGLRNDVTPFNVDNNSFPVLINAYQWRGRVKRKRGTSFLNRLTRNLYSQALGNTSGGELTVNIFTQLSIPTTASIVVSYSGFSISDGTNTFTDNGDGTLTGTPGGSGTINYATGALTLTGAAAAAPVTITFAYYPGLPVLGLEPFVSDSTDFPAELGFDQTYSYNISLSSPFNVHSVNFYNNPASPATLLPGYTQKTSWTPFTWNLRDYQQIWTTNYQGALWAVAGIEDPFNSGAHIGMQFKRISAATVVSATDVDFTTSNNHPFVAGDFVFVNEVDSITGLNMHSGYVLAAPAPTATTFRARFPTATIAGGPGTIGMVQALTTSCQPDVPSTIPGSTRDCIRWYNGDPVSNVAAGTFTTNKGWVNFSPPLTTGNVGTFTIADLPPAQYYLVGARMVVPFKDRLLFFGPVLQTSSATVAPIYLPDTIVYSQNGTPFYTASYIAAGDYPTIPELITNPMVPILVPNNQSAQPQAFFENASGFGGFISAGYARPITSVSINEDALIVGLADRQTRLLYTGNDIVPFNFYVINSELGSESTFSTVTLDRGVISVGGRGIILTSQISSQRIDLEIPDEIFRFKLTNQGSRRVCSQRDFINEWIYMTYPSNIFKSKYPTRTLQYNYRDNSWAIFNETYTTYGLFRQRTGYTWGTIGTKFPTWESWNEPWSAGSTTLLQPQVIAGNQQGFIVFRDDGTDESPSLFISNMSGSIVTSPDHSLNSGDYIVIQNAIGTVASQVNDKIFSVAEVTTNTFTLNPAIAGGTYLGNGTIKRMYIPFIQTKQFPVAWQDSRKTRLGTQRYLFSRTQAGKCTLYIYLSQNASTKYNFGQIIPSQLSVNNTLIYSTILYTCPESTNIGLTPANINLQLITADDNAQLQIWHRMNTSLIGDTVQVAITFDDAQMRDVNFSQQFSELELHSIIMDVYPSQELV